MLRTLRTQGQALAVRRTSPHGPGPTGPGDPRSAAAYVHLVGTAAGPMGGDVVEVRLAVGPGAQLHVAGVAATVVLPSRSQARSELVVELDVAAGGRLVCALPPVVVTGRAELQAATRVRLVEDGQVRLVEHVRLGRYAEPGGWWRARLDVTRDGAPLLRQTTTLGEVADHGGPRDLRSVLDTADPAQDAEGQDAGDAGVQDDQARTVVLRPATGGSLVVTLG